MRLIATSLSVLSILATLTVSAHAHDVDSDVDVPENTLQGHRFVTPRFVPTPFVSSTVNFQQGVFRFTIPDFPVTRRRTYDVSAIGITEQLKVGVQLFDFMQVFVDLQAELLAGSNVESIVLAGTTYNYRMGGGLMARVFRSGHSGTQVSVRAEIASGPLGQVDLLAFANDVIDSDAAAVENLFDLQITRSALASGSETVFRAHALLAQTLTPNFGVQAFAGLTGLWESLSVYDARDERDVDSSANSFSPDAGVSIDATLLPSILLGFHLEYLLRAQRRNVEDSAGAQDTQLLHTVSAGIHVIDSRYQVGLSVGSLFGLDTVERTGAGDVRLTSGSPTNLFAHFGMQYLW